MDSFRNSCCPWVCTTCQVAVEELFLASTSSLIYNLCFRWLLSRGGYIKDNERVLKALKKKRLWNIAKILQHNGRFQETVDISSSDEEKTGSSLVICEDCGIEYMEEEKAAHLGSIPHQLAKPTHLEHQNPGFGIAEGNLGFRLLQRGGWDGR